MAKSQSTRELLTAVQVQHSKLINLLGAELTVGKHREDIDLIERCVRAKLFAHVDGVSATDHAAGVALAHSLVEPVLKDLRERVERLQPAPMQPPTPSVAATLH